MRTLPSYVALSLTASLLALACAGEDDPLALDEPIVVHQGNFKHGDLPGTPDDGTDAPKLAVTTSEVSSGSLRASAVDVSLIGRTTADAYSVGVSLLGQGTGYWVRPVGAEDILTPGERNFELSFDVGADVEPGRHKIALVAIGKDGKAGQQSTTDVCIRSDLPDNGNACKPENEPPVTIASLRWNTDADLDLIVIAPDGTRYSRSNFSQVVDGKVVARLEADGVSGCMLDGRRYENFLWNQAPAKGTWYVYANLFDSCQKTAVRFELTIYRKKSLGNGQFTLVEEKSVSGELLRAQTKASADKPLYLSEITFP